MDWVTARNRKEKLVEMMKVGNWRQVLGEFTEDPSYREPLLVWVKPSLACLEWLADQVRRLMIVMVMMIIMMMITSQVRRLGLAHLASVGCGCGTLEWLLQAATGAHSQ